MADGENINFACIIADCVENSIDPTADAVSVLPVQFHASRRTRDSLQCENGFCEPASLSSLERVEFLFHLPPNENRVRTTQVRFARLAREAR